MASRSYLIGPRSGSEDANLELVPLRGGGAAVPVGKSPRGGFCAGAPARYPGCMAYIETIHEMDADGKLAALYQRYGNPDGTVDNVLKLHSLNPESLEAHAQLYVQAMHRSVDVSRIELEIIAVTVSRLNGCEYCLQHHAAGLRRLLPEGRKGIVDELVEGDESSLETREAAIAALAEKLTREPSSVDHHDIDMLRGAALSDTEILDVVQAISYFAYVNRVAIALGAELEDHAKIGQWPME